MMEWIVPQAMRWNFEAFHNLDHLYLSGQTQCRHFPSHALLLREDDAPLVRVAPVARSTQHGAPAKHPTAVQRFAVAAGSETYSFGLIVRCWWSLHYQGSLDNHLSISQVVICYFLNVIQ
jgi:hypothetical protein